MTADTLKIILTIVFAAGGVVMSVRQLERRVERIEKTLDDHILPNIQRRN